MWILVYATEDRQIESIKQYPDSNMLCKAVQGSTSARYCIEKKKNSEDICNAISRAIRELQRRK
jgi:hypothetical protein